MLATRSRAGIASSAIGARRARSALAQNSVRRDFSRTRGVPREPRLDQRLPLRFKAAVDQAVQVVLADRARIPAHLTLLSRPVRPVSRNPRIRVRARLNRDITVPSGTPSTCAASA